MSDELVPYKPPVLEGTVETQVDCRCERPTKLWPGERCSACGAIAVKFRDGALWNDAPMGRSIYADIVSLIEMLENGRGSAEPRGITTEDGYTRHRCVTVEPTWARDEERYGQSRVIRDEVERNWSGRKLREPSGVVSADKS